MLASRTLLVIALASGLLLAGCIAEPQVSTSSTTTQSAGAGGRVAVSAASGADAIAFLNDYVMTHPFRINSQPSFQATARDDLEALLLDFGLEVQRHEYATGMNILAIKNGTTKPDEWIVLSAHYDTTESTVYGAWDDGAGTAMLLALAKAGAQQTHERTVVYAFFDEEEQGLLGSKAFVEEHVGLVHFAANINFDPPGLNYPCADAQGPLPVKVIFEDAKIEEGVRGYVELRDAILAGLDAAQIPEDARDFDPGIPIVTAAGEGVTGTSDHASFGKIDVPNVFVGSAPTVRAGPIAGLSYLLHTPIDTAQQMEIRCGGADLLEQAFQKEIDITLTALSILDKEPTLSPE